MIFGIRGGSRYGPIRPRPAPLLTATSCKFSLFWDYVSHPPPLPISTLGPLLLQILDPTLDMTNITAVIYTKLPIFLLGKYFFARKWQYAICTVRQWGLWFNCWLAITYFWSLFSENHCFINDCQQMEGMMRRFKLVYRDSTDDRKSFLKSNMSASMIRSAYLRFLEIVFWNHEYLKTIWL